ncbi:uncharacterized protein LOC125031786 isoform X1 [Penaeus chinensis]|uniref:uncharacterized protein LOC125031786 isoform X1 n=1 Tax=Penaeus chinensis TaxID=139456 RepID=UPI001FB63A50|nr:uncharacterized protein LOC125031786 isoform X1 [Penaeus chinensis]
MFILLFSLVPTISTDYKRTYRNPPKITRPCSRMFFSDSTNANGEIDLFNNNLTLPDGSLQVINYSLTLLAIGVLIGALISLLLEMARNGPTSIADAIVRGVDAVRLDGMFNSIGSAVENGVNSIPIKRTGPAHSVPAGARRRRR